MNIVAYCRVSTDKDDQLNSLDAQKGFFVDFCEKNNHTLVRLYADEGISGTKIKNRKEFLKLMDDAKRGLFEMVIVKDISRFARNTVDFLQSIRALKALSIETVFLTSNQTVLGSSEFILTIFGALAQEESSNTSKRVKFGKKINAQKGRVPNIVYGYDKTCGEYFDLAINPNEAQVVRRIFDMYVHQGYGAAKISNLLNQEGVKTKRGYGWSQNGVGRVIQNALYIGEIVNGKEEVADFLTGVRKRNDPADWITVSRPELGIVDPDIFHSAQQIWRGRCEAFCQNHERQSNKHLFSTLIRCKQCGYSFRRTERTYKNTYVRWVCSGRNANGTGSCSNRIAVDEGELMDFLQRYFAETLSRKQNIIQHVIREFTRSFKSGDDTRQCERELKEKQARLQRTKQKYIDLYADDILSCDELKNKISGIHVELKRIGNELSLLEGNIGKRDRLEQVIGNAFQRMEDVADVRGMTNAQLKRIIRFIEVDDEANVDIYLRLFGDMGLDESILVGDNGTQGHA